MTSSNGSAGVTRVGVGPWARASSAPTTPAAALFKLLWKRTRPTDPEVAVRGDREAVHRFLASRLTP